jgi:DNA-binding IclR family transcriptional regulator
MLGFHRDVHVGFDQFQELLLAMRVGEEMRASDAAQATGLSLEVCRSVLDGLQRAGLMTHAGGDRFVRRTLEMAKEGR